VRIVHLADYLELAYTQLNNRYAEITDFRAKLLGLLPLATGTGAFLLLERTQDQYDELRRSSDRSGF
jgi:hypothetical protein